MEFGGQKSNLTELNRESSGKKMEPTYADHNLKTFHCVDKKGKKKKKLPWGDVGIRRVLKVGK